jgi:transposase-like protein
MNFGRPAVDRAKWSHTAPGDPKYNLHGSGKKAPCLRCQLCNEIPPIKSNIAVKEEFDRMMGELSLPSEPTCPTETCKNHALGVISNKSDYYRFGMTKGGSQRYKCKSCSRLFTQAMSSTLRQRDKSINEDIFKLIINKMPMRRICEIMEINAETLYQQLGFLAEQCRLYSAFQEKQFDTIDIPRLNIALDRQRYEINWSTNKDRRRVALLPATKRSLIGDSWSRTTGLSLSVNFDSVVTISALEG